MIAQTLLRAAHNEDLAATAVETLKEIASAIRETSERDRQDGLISDD
jgi:hypothetical protein